MSEGKARRMSGTRKKKNKKGTTLVEVLVSMIILAVGIAGAARMVMATRQFSDVASEKYAAVNLAKSRFEQMSMSNLDDLPSWSISNVVSNAQGRPDPDGNFRVNTVVNYIQTNLAEIVIQVYTRNHMTRQFDHAPEQITTYLTDL